MKDPNIKRLQKISQKVLNGTATEAEKRFLDQYYDLFDSQKNDINDLTDNETEIVHHDVKNRLKFTTGAEKREKPPLYYLSRVAASIALLTIASIAVFTIANRQHPTASTAQLKINKPIVHGSNRATLTLDDGTKIDLDDKSAGTLAKRSGIQITKNTKGEVIYTSTTNVDPQIAANKFNILQTPRGGIYQVSLPDGTKVWLNSSSTLKYPVLFTGDERKVELEGEAYFEVKHNAAMPFRVVSNTQTVEVLGTHFNVNAYPDEDYSKTTLLQGSVRVSVPTAVKPMVLVPGQQSIAKPMGIKVRKVDVDNTIAWKNGLFQFDNEEIHSIMKKVGRWYDVDVEYEPGISKLYFGGTVSRYADIEKVLNKLVLTKTIHFKIDGRRILVMK